MYLYYSLYCQKWGYKELQIKHKRLIIFDKNLYNHKRIFILKKGRLSNE